MDWKSQKEADNINLGLASNGEVGAEAENIRMETMESFCLSQRGSKLNSIGMFSSWTELRRWATRQLT